MEFKSELQDEMKSAMRFAEKSPWPTIDGIEREVMAPRTINVDMRTAIRMAMNEEMEQDDRVLLMGEEVGDYNGAYKVSKGMLEQWGEKRVIDTPICESAFTGLAIGAAMAGLRPIVEFMSFNFSFLAIDQIFSNAATMYYMSAGRFSVPIVFRGPNGAAAQVMSAFALCGCVIRSLSRFNRHCTIEPI